MNRKAIGSVGLISSEIGQMITLVYLVINGAYTRELN